MGQGMPEIASDSSTKLNETTATSAYETSPSTDFRLSVIIPTLNEESNVGAAVDHVFAAAHEVIVVDCGSTDRTQDVAAAHGALVITASRGRGRQQNAGAAAASGSALLFLHADTRLPTSFPALIRSALAQPGVSAGAFRLAIDAPARSLRLVERMAALRCRLLQLPYGDQGLFVAAENFRRVGGFPDSAVMEDYELVRRLKRLGRIVILDEPAATSARRWLKLGVWKATWTNQVCLAAYRIGVPSDRIARWRDRP
jgi:rSAM/selenodomain-associated transferase 2